jgi:hypothetical protein
MYDLFLLETRSGGDQLERFLECVLIVHTILAEDLNIKAQQHNVFILQQYATSL